MTLELPDYPGQLRAPETFQSAEAEADLSDYADLAEVLEAAEREGVVDVPAEDKAAALRGEANLVRERTIAERLWLLGYLKDPDDLASSRRDADRMRFLRAVADFQRGAGLVVDEWTGEMTWQALQELVTFESPTNIARYTRQGRPLPALARATRLRLWSLGVLSRKPGARESSDTVPEESLQKFRVLCGRFKLFDSLEGAPDTLTIIRYLFDQDALLRAVADMGRLRPVGGRERWVFAYLKHPSETRRKTDPQVESFLACLAKIELWLLGFNVDISHSRNYPVYKFLGRTANRNRKMTAALAQFWDRVGPGATEAEQGLGGAELRRKRKDRKRLREFITPELFKALANPELSTTLADPDLAETNGKTRAAVREDYSREVTEKLSSQEEIEKTWSKGKRLGMKLWDGVRRVWRWIRRGLAKILEVGRNLVRAFFRYSLKAFEIAKRTITVMAKSIAQYARGEIKTGSRVQLLLAHDGDVRASLPIGAQAQELGGAAQRLRYFGASFELSCRILATIMRIARTAVIGALGWARLLWLLVRSYRDIRPLYKELQAVPVPRPMQAVSSAVHSG